MQEKKTKETVIRSVISLAILATLLAPISAERFYQDPTWVSFTCATTGK